MKSRKRRKDSGRVRFQRGSNTPGPGVLGGESSGWTLTRTSGLGRKG